MNAFSQRVLTFYQKSKRAKRIVAEFFLMHPEEAAFLTLDELAQKTGVSASTITRASSEMGFQGYPGLQEEIRKSIRRGLAPIERLEQQILPKDSLGYRESIAIDQQNISLLLSMNDSETIEQCIETLASSPHIYLTATRSSYGSVSFLGIALAQIRPGICVLSENEGRLPEQILDIQAGDLLIALSLPRYSRMVLDTMQTAKERGCKIISISDAPTSPLAKLSDISLFVPYESYSFFNSTVPALALFNALATGANIRLGDKALHRLQENGKLIDIHRVLLENSFKFSEPK